MSQGAPHVKTIEWDLTHRPSLFQGLYGLIIGAFDRGPVNDRFYVSTVTQTEAAIGSPKIGSDIAYYTASTFLTKSRRLWLRRLVADALYGGAFIGASFTSGLGLGDGVTKEFSGIVAHGRCFPSTVTIFIDNVKVGYATATGRIVGGDYLEGTVDVLTGQVDVVFDSPPPVNSILYIRWGFPNIRFTEGLRHPEDYDFDGRNLTLDMRVVDGEINDILVPGGIVLPETTGEPDEEPVTHATSTVVIFDNGFPIMYCDDEGYLFPTVAEGEYAVPPYYDNGACGTLDPISGKIDASLGTYIIKGAITTEYVSRRADAFVVYQDNPGNWGEGYYIVVSGVDTVDNTFTINVLEESDNRFLNVQGFNLSREHKTDGFERQMHCETINGTNYYIRIKDNPYLNDTEALPQVTQQHSSLTTRSRIQLFGGDNGRVPHIAAYIRTLREFSNKDEVKINVVMDTLMEPNFQYAVAKLCDSEMGGRGDCYGILHMPYEKEAQTNYIKAMLDYRMYDLNLYSSCVGLYTGQVLIYDDHNGRELYIPSTGFVGAAFSYTADMYAPWFPVAGWNRGRLPVRKILRTMEDGDHDILYDHDINFLRFKPGKGISIGGQKTMYGRTSARSRANVRMLLIATREPIEDYLDDNNFELNTPRVRAVLSSVVGSFLEGIQLKEGIYRFKVVCDGSNNPDDNIDDYKLNLDWYIAPTRAIEYITSRVILTPTSMSFEEAQYFVGTF